MSVAIKNPDAPATGKQTWAIFCMTGWDVRQCGLTVLKASQLIDHLKEGKPFIPDDYEGAVQVRGIPKTVDRDKYQRIYSTAHEAGMAALEACVPTPMVVQEHENMLDDNSKVKQSYFVEDGVCGFAWVNIKPATTGFCRWLKEKGYVENRSYYGGYDVWIHEGGQSLQKKEAYAREFARVLNDNGIKAMMMSRLD